MHVSINDNSRGQMHHLYFISDGCKLASCKRAVFFKVCMIFIDNTMTSWFPVASVFFPIKLGMIALQTTPLPSTLCVSSSARFSGNTGQEAGPVAQQGEEVEGGRGREHGLDTSQAGLQNGRGTAAGRLFPQLHKRENGRSHVLRQGSGPHYPCLL